MTDEQPSSRSRLPLVVAAAVVGALVVVGLVAAGVVVGMRIQSSAAESPSPSPVPSPSPTPEPSPEPSTHILDVRLYDYHSQAHGGCFSNRRFPETSNAIRLVEPTSDWQGGAVLGAPVPWTAGDITDAGGLYCLQALRFQGVIDAPFYEIHIVSPWSGQNGRKWGPYSFGDFESANWDVQLNAG